jgi:hypothetical protein
VFSPPRQKLVYGRKVRPILEVAALPELQEYSTFNIQSERELKPLGRSMLNVEC